MHKRLLAMVRFLAVDHRLLVAMFVLVTVSGFILVASQVNQASSASVDIRPVTSTYTPAPNGFTTVIDSQLATTDDGQPADDTPELFAPEPLVNLHSSDILLAVDEVVQDEYFAMVTPNDISYPLWYLDDIGAESAWDISTGSSDVVVAVIDSGYALDHEELSSRWFINAGEQGTTQPGDICWTGTPASKQTNNCDDDDNGYTDDWRGWDFANLDNSPQAGEVNPSGDGVEHGSLVAGVLAATGNNTVGFPSS